MDVNIELNPLSLLGPQSRFGDKTLGIKVVCPKTGLQYYKGLRTVTERTKNITRYYYGGP